MHRAVWINRPFYGVIYRSLRQPGYRFWLEVFAAQIVIVLIGLFLLEVVARQDRGLGLDLALQAVGLSIQERQCGAHSDWCRYLVAVLSFGQRVFEWVVSAVVIVRVFRGVARKRWRFDEKAVLIDGELKIRVASLKPGTILGLEFTVEAVVKPWRYVPLRLTNGGTLSLMADVAMLLRHPIDDESPFSSPSWRDEVRAVSITIMGYDQTINEHVMVNHLYLGPKDFVEGKRFSDANRMTDIGQEYATTHPTWTEGDAHPMVTSIFDYDRLDGVA